MKKNDLSENEPDKSSSRYLEQKLAHTDLSKVATVTTGVDTGTVDKLIERRLVRSTAALSSFILLVAALALLLGQPLVAGVALGMQTIAFASGWKAPLRHPYRALARGLRSLFREGGPEHLLPVRFAGLVGLCFTAPALISTMLGWTTAATVLTLSCGVAAALNAFQGVCLACLMYPRVQIVRSRLAAYNRR